MSSGILICIALLIMLAIITPDKEKPSKKKKHTEVILETLNINTATAEEFIEIGFPRRTAEYIVEYRFENGDFYELEELLHVKGIGEDILNRYRDKLSVY